MAGGNGRYASERAARAMMLWTDNARVFAVLAVVFLHVNLWSRDAGQVDGYDLWIGLIYDHFVRWAVPVFVMVSGALLLDPSKTESLPDFYKKRASRVLIPLLFWSIFFLAWSVGRDAVRGKEASIYALAKSLVSGTPYYHMWFLYMITGLYLFTPFLRKIVNHSTRSELILLVSLLFGLSALSEVLNQLESGEVTVFIYRFLPYLPYFFAGHLVNTASTRPRKWVLCLVFISTAVLTTLGSRLSGLYFGKGYFFEYLSITVVPMAISVTFLLKEASAPIINARMSHNLALLSLGIYVIHPVFIGGLRLEPLGFSALSRNPALVVPITTILVFGLSLAAAKLINWAPYVKRII